MFVSFYKNDPHLLLNQSRNVQNGVHQGRIHVQPESAY